MCADANASAVIDGHAHYYDAHDPGRWLDAAWRNMAAAGGRNWQGCLMLARTGRARSPAQLAARLAGSGWRAEPTDEPDSLVAIRRGGGHLLLVGGHQLATAERVEVLSFGAAAADGEPLTDTVTAVAAAGGLAVLPWAFGKWLALSPATLDILHRLAPGRLLLGDNRGRPRALPAAWPFRWAERRGIAVLPGSDPLPLADHAELAGSYGFVLDGWLDEARPAAALRARLAALTGQPRRYGNRVSLSGFCREQLRLRTTPRRRELAHAA